MATLLAVQHTLAVAATNLNQLAKVANATGEVSPGHPSDRGQGGGRRRDRGRLSCNPQSRYVSKSPGSSPGYAKPSTDNSAVTQDATTSPASTRLTKNHEVRLEYQ